MYRLHRRGATGELWDGAARLVATTQVRGDVAFATLEIECPPSDERFRSSPDRRVMPTRWRLSRSSGGPETVFSRQIGRALLNPWGRALVTMERQPPAFGSYRVVDARRSGLGRALNLERSDWALVRGDEPVGRLGFVRRPGGDQEETGGGGLLGRVRGVARALTYDRALLPFGAAHDGSAGTERDLTSANAHDLSPAEALVLLLLFESFTSNS